MQMRTSKNYLLGVLLVTLTFNFLDRLALGVVLQDIKRDLNLNDTQLGLLAGIAFALFYSVMGVPIARWADRGNRVTIITLTTALWSIGVALCGAATNFAQLLLVRVGVAVGEAGCMPPALSLIADYFERGERPRAAAIYTMGASLSLVIGFPVAGWINQWYGWRAVFIMLGLPGLLLALLIVFTLQEPRVYRTQLEGPSVAPGLRPSQPSLKEVWLTLWAIRTFRHLLFSFSLIVFFGYGILQWQPAFFIRSHGLSATEVGVWFAGAYGICSLLGTWLGGEMASRLAPVNERLQLRAMALASALSGLFMACIYLAPNRHLALTALAISTFVGTTINGPLFAIIQTLVPPRMRAMSIALIYLLANLIGMGFGPLAAGIASDALRMYVGDESLRYALLMLCPGYLLVMAYLWRGSNTVTRDIEAAALRLDRLSNRDAAVRATEPSSS